MKIIPGVSTYIRRIVQSATDPELKVGDIHKVVRWCENTRPVIIHPGTGEEYPCLLEFWEDASFEGSLQKILEE